MKPQYKIAEVFHRFAPDLIQQGRLSADQIKAINLISVCKTAALGGHREACDNCSYTRIHYNSCGNRHCPSCQGVNKERWILERTYDLLPVKYFHCVFTLPAQLRTLTIFNKKTIYELLFKSVKDTLLTFGFDPRQKIEGKIGGISILHTWNQQMEFHPHLHVIVPNGGITPDGEWVTSRGKDNFLFHVKALSDVFKGKFLDVLKGLFQNEQITIPPNFNGSDVPSAASNLIDQLYKTKWVVYAKQAFHGPMQVLEYLARYTHKICISNYRISKITDTHVTFRYLDRKNKTSKVRTVRGDQFVLLFAQHVLPKGFTKIRHFGFLAPRCKTKAIALIRSQLKVDSFPEKPDKRLSARQVMMTTSGKDPYKCPCCKTGNLLITQFLQPIRGSPIKKIYRIVPKDRIVILEL
jgi:hypothetical protein